MSGLATEIKPGTALPNVTKTIDLPRLVRYAGASGDFNQIHYDDGYAKAAGLGAVIGQGMLTMGFVSEAVTNWLGDPGLVKEITVRFVGMTRLGDTLTIGGEVAEIEEGPDGPVAKVVLRCTNQNGQAIVDQCRAMVKLAR